MTSHIIEPMVCSILVCLILIVISLNSKDEYFKSGLYKFIMLYMSINSMVLIFMMMFNSFV